MYAVAAIALHNYLRMTNKVSYSPTDFIDRKKNNDGEVVPGAWGKVLTNDGVAGALRDLANVKGSRYQTCTVTQRDNLQSYFMNTGAVGVASKSCYQWLTCCECLIILFRMDFCVYVKTIFCMEVPLLFYININLTLNSLNLLIQEADCVVATPPLVFFNTAAVCWKILMIRCHIIDSSLHGLRCF